VETAILRADIFFPPFAHLLDCGKQLAILSLSAARAAQIDDVGDTEKNQDR
jgi:hypothetical protein